MSYLKISLFLLWFFKIRLMRLSRWVNWKISKPLNTWKIFPRNMDLKDVCKLQLKKILIWRKHSKKLLILFLSLEESNNNNNNKSQIVHSILNLKINHQIMLNKKNKNQLNKLSSLQPILKPKKKKRMVVAEKNKIKNNNLKIKIIILSFCNKFFKISF